MLLTSSLGAEARYYRRCDINYLNHDSGQRQDIFMTEPEYSYLQLETVKRANELVKMAEHTTKSTLHTTVYS